MPNQHESLQEDREHLREILNREEFVQHRDEHEPLLEQLWQWVEERLFGWLPETAADDGFMAVIPYVMVVIALGLIVFLMYWLSTQMVRRKYMSGNVLLEEEELELKAGDYLHKAKASRDRNERQEGVRYAFLGLLMHWESHNVLQVEAWKTNGEYAREIHSRKKELLPFFREAAHLFDRVWYGKEEISARDFERFLQKVEEEMRAGETNG
ncbi:DUF4129 domain-containing protein [Salicibibacter cibarius]|uniref:DUF4129 domain-containing protein n=1 Tax=Salicibibacter cibarius TaxID=2743000 RepID=A0A7T6Z6A0_9BACI|nr:DUF4129 domain-containing protein [Salicibibacter cibarius]QQK77586.1 DUF4129 domain-containing protein [Salicibibacter cibarius]